MDLVSIDPGLRAAGWAHFDDKRLVACGCSFADVGNGPRQWRAMANELRTVSGCETLVIERMEPRTSMSAAFDALVELTIISGMLADSHEGELVFLRPSIWTGKFDKTVNHHRIRKRLTQAEEDLVDAVLVGIPPDNHKEVLDAVGIGLYQVRRLR